jgi:hypothetical protein
VRSVKGAIMQLFCVALGIALAIPLGDYLFPDAAASLGFRVFGIIKGAIGVAVYQAISSLRARRKEGSN